MESALPGQATTALDSVIWIGSLVFVAVVVLLFFLWTRRIKKK